MDVEEAKAKQVIAHERLIKASISHDRAWKAERAAAEEEASARKDYEEALRVTLDAVHDSLYGP